MLKKKKEETNPSVIEPDKNFLIISSHFLILLKLKNFLVKFMWKKYLRKDIEKKNANNSKNDLICVKFTYKMMRRKT